MKLEYIVVYENSSDELDIEHHRIKVKVTVGFKNFPYLPQYKLSGPITQLCYELGSLIISSSYGGYRWTTGHRLCQGYGISFPGVS